MNLTILKDYQLGVSGESNKNHPTTVPQPNAQYTQKTKHSKEKSYKIKCGKYKDTKFSI